MYSIQMVRSQSHLVSRDARSDYCKQPGLLARQHGSVLAGSINRLKLGGVIFKDFNLRRRLNKATHLPIQLHVLCNILYYTMRFTPTVVRPFLSVNALSRCLLCALPRYFAWPAAVVELGMLNGQHPSVAVLPPNTDRLDTVYSSPVLSAGSSGDRFRLNQEAR